MDSISCFVLALFWTGYRITELMNKIFRSKYSSLRINGESLFQDIRISIDKCRGQDAYGTKGGAYTLRHNPGVTILQYYFHRTPTAGEGG